MSYTLDVYRGKVRPAWNFFDFALYVSYFPQLIAGPIERGTRLLPQILEPRTVTVENLYRGAYIFFWGLFLKVFIADNLARIVDPVFAPQASYDGASVLLAVYAFSYQIYCDFAGYSFMAIGLGMAMGIELMENFRRPYFSKNISDFWRRWHISLSSWFRDYVFSPFYIYLGKRPLFRRLPMKRRHDVAFFVTLLSAEFMLGLWHGAGWNFALFGVYHGIVIWAYYYLKKYWDRMNTLVQIVLTYHVACVGWLVFRAPTFGQAVDMARGLVLNFSLDVSRALAVTALTIAGLVAILITIQVFQDLKNDTFVVLRLPMFPRLALIASMACLVLVFGDFSDRPFIYFQF
jgi:alginate O-acetyltransferase complex protein AlgI